MSHTVSFAQLSLNYIEGRWLGEAASARPVIDPATGETLCLQAMAAPADVDLAVRAACKVHRSGALSEQRPVERARTLHKMAVFISAHQEEIAATVTLEQGKPLWESRLEVAGAARFVEYYANLAESLEGRSIPLGGDYVDFTEMEPRGVTAHIIPWNYPFEMTARSLAPALATGNPCVVKTPEMTPLSNLWYARAAEACGLPAGAVNIVCGLGAVAGAALASHPLINLLVFTGSVRTGISVAHAAAENVVPTVLELGGKSAAIVYPDADLNAFEANMRYGIFYNAGQTCSAMARVVVHESRVEELLERAGALARSLSVGPGIERTQEGLSMGALVCNDRRDAVVGMVSRAQAQGVRIIAGGSALSGPGAFMQPTVLCAAEPSLEIAQEEVFGPVLTVLSFKGDEEAVAIANGTRFGLVAGVFTRDIERAMRAARALRGGQVFINEWFAGGVETPFGGVGRSGFGREKGREGMMNYVQTKNIAIRL